MKVTLTLPAGSLALHVGCGSIGMHQGSVLGPVAFYHVIHLIPNFSGILLILELI